MSNSFNIKRSALWWGPLISIAIMIFVRPDPENPAIGYTLAAAALMAIWWITEVVPLAVTSLLPVALFPLLGIMDGKDVSSAYFNHVIFLFIGGFLVALAMQRWNLHRRIALSIMAITGTGKVRVLLGFMLATSFLSMWISNTATAMMMVPIGASVIAEFETDQSDKKQSRKFGIAVLLGIAYSASIGGTMTLVGTPPNLSFIRIYQIMFPQAPEISFANWLLFALPSGLIMLAIAWILLIVLFRLHKGTSVHFRRVQIREMRQKLGPMSAGEKIVFTIFILMALLWVTRSPIDLGGFRMPGWSELFKHPEYLNDGTVAIALSIPLFFIRTRRKKALKPVLNWKTATKLPWGIVLLFGGGFALANGFRASGLSLWLGEQMQWISGMPIFLVILMIALFMTFLTELTSNTATTEMILPVLSGIAIATHTHPLLLMLPATLSGSMAFMLPVATPPNAIIFGTGKIKVTEMARTGLLLNLIGGVVIATSVYFIGRLVFHIDLSQFPAWAVNGM